MDPLNIGGSEWVIILFVVLALILGTGKLPDAARKLGQASREFNKARSDIEEHARSISGGTVKVKGPVESERQKFETIAGSLGIDHKDMSTAELRKAITERVGYKDPGAKPPDA